jgi:1,4-alpha-glucan branching enzyme
MTLRGAPPDARGAEPGAAEVQAIVRGTHGAAFDVLGPHAFAGPGGKPAIAVRAFLPGATAAVVRRGRGRTPMERVHADGFFVATFPETAKPFAYKLEITFGHDSGPLTVVRDDPYRFGPILTSFDLHLFNEGTHVELYDRLGAHARAHERVAGVTFAVWAPNARRVSVVANFNRWDGSAHPMRLRAEAGIWELFVPGLGPGEVYKYEILTAEGALVTKADPFGQFMERRPDTASIVVSEQRRPWNDTAWVRRRPRAQALDRPLAIYEVHAGSWRRVPDAGAGAAAGDPSQRSGRFPTWKELAETLVPYVADLGFTHIELMPVTEHPLDASWGYQTVGYFAPSARFGPPDEFRAFVDAAHAAGIGVLLDWVPAHFPKDAHGLGAFDGTHLYEHADPRKGHHPDWGTAIFNYGRPQVAEFLLSSALYWFERFHVDGLRVDAVASMLYLDYSRKEGEWVPNRLGGRENLEAIEFLKRFNALVHERFPGALTAAEESTSWPGVSRPVHLGGLGFDLKWNMGWMHDTLEYMALDPLFRRNNHAKMTFSLYYAWNENYLLPLSHDEVVHGKYALLSKMPGDVVKRFANLRALYASMYAHPGKKLLFMGAEFGQWREWHEDRQLDWHLLDDIETGPWHRGLLAFVRALNQTYRATPALHEIDFHWSGFAWIDFRDVEQSVLVYLRRGRDPRAFLVVAANYTPVARPGYRVGVPAAESYEEILNSDAAEWGGTGTGNPGRLIPEAVEWQGQPQSLVLTLPPVGVIYLRPHAPAALPPQTGATT